jgi:hypothetical protein
MDRTVLLSLDLNSIEVPDDGSSDYRRAASARAGIAQAFFDGLEDRMCDFVRAHDLVVGCMAWFTSFPVLDAMAGRRAAIVVQKEDFLRPDGPIDPKDPNRRAWRVRLREAYSRLRAGPDRLYYPNLASSLSVCSDPNIDAVRCVGVRNAGHGTPRMHHKFLVGCHVERWEELIPAMPATRAVEDLPLGTRTNPWALKILGAVSTPEYTEVGMAIEPTAVWTGSFNASGTAARSLENAVVLRDPTIARAYFDEFAHVLALSEPLDWSSEYVAPEWRIGT